MENLPACAWGTIEGLGSTDGGEGGLSRDKRECRITRSNGPSVSARFGPPRIYGVLRHRARPRQRTTTSRPGAPHSAATSPSCVQPVWSITCQTRLRRSQGCQKRASVLFIAVPPAAVAYSLRGPPDPLIKPIPQTKFGAY